MTYEKDILELRSAGHSYNSIAKELGCSKSTVAYYCGMDQQKKTKNRQRDKRNAKRKVVQEFKTGKPCMDCNIEYPYYVMDFDHRPDEIKIFTIGIMYKHITMGDLLKEIAKCDLVCANCHRYRTWQRLRKVASDGG
jgi:transposase